jgi:hypothetical protein
MLRDAGFPIIACGVRGGKMKLGTTAAFLRSGRPATPSLPPLEDAPPSCA